MNPFPPDPPSQKPGHVCESADGCARADNDVIFNDRSHANTVVPECLRTITQVNWKVENSTSAPSETPEPIVT